MLYSEAGQLRVSYRDQARVFRLRQEALEVYAIVLVGFVVVPVLGNDYWFTAILTPFLILSLAGIGLNLLTGYAGQLSVGTAAFMAVGAYGAYGALRVAPGIPLLCAFAAGGLAAAVLGVFVGLPSARIKGFYLVVCTLAAQFFVEWAFTRFRWFANGDASGLVSVPPLAVLGLDLRTALGRYVVSLVVVALLTALALRLVRSELGRRFMAVRDMDTAAAVIGIPVLATKLIAFAVSGFYCGVAGALWGFAYLGTFDARAFELTRSFQVLFIAIVGGMGSIVGNFFGAAFMLLLPIAMSHLTATALGGAIDQGNLENYKKIAFGILIIVVLIGEPGGLTKLLRTARARARVWPLREWG